MKSWKTDAITLLQSTKEQDLTSEITLSTIQIRNCVFNFCIYFKVKPTFFSFRFLLSVYCSCLTFHSFIKRVASLSKHFWVSRVTQALRPAHQKESFQSTTWNKMVKQDAAIYNFIAFSFGGICHSHLLTRVELFQYVKVW